MAVKFTVYKFFMVSNLLSISFFMAVKFAVYKFFMAVKMNDKTYLGVVCVVERTK